MHPVTVAKRERFLRLRVRIDEPEVRDALTGVDHPSLVLIDSTGRRRKQLARLVGHDGTMVRIGTFRHRFALPATEVRRDNAVRHVQFRLKDDSQAAGAARPRPVCATRSHPELSLSRHAARLASAGHEACPQALRPPCGRRVQHVLTGRLAVRFTRRFRLDARAMHFPFQIAAWPRTGIWQRNPAVRRRTCREAGLCRRTHCGTPHRKSSWMPWLAAMVEVEVRVTVS